MISEKIGKGGKGLESYDTKNGEYVRNPIAKRDEDNLIMQKLFGLQSNKTICYPVFGVHDLEYCNNLIRYGLDLIYPQISESKINNYLFVKPSLRKWFNLLGYSKENALDIYYSIIRGTDFKDRKFKKFTMTSLIFNTTTRIYNRRKGCYYNCITGWHVNRDFTIRLITLIPNKNKGE